MHHETRRPHKLKVECYAAHMTEIIEHLGIFTGCNPNNKFVKEDMNKLLIHSMQNFWGNHKFLQDFILNQFCFKNL